MAKNDKVEILKLLASHQRPYFSQEIFSLNLVERKELPVLVTDQYFRLYWSEKAIENLTPKQQVSVLLQCMYPLLLDHSLRAKNIEADPELWWIAANMEIACLLEDDCWELPIGTPRPELFRFERNQIAETYYRALADEAEKNGKSSVLQKAGVSTTKPDSNQNGEQEKDGSGAKPNSGSSVDGKQKPWEEEYSEKNGLNRLETEQIRQTVAQEIKSCGKVPAGLARWADALFENKVDWRKECRSIIRNAIENIRGIGDFSYSIFRRRSPPGAGILLPASVTKKLKVAVVIDTSGSMGDSEISEALTEVKGILKTLPVSDGVYAIACDAAVHSAKKVFDAKQVEVKGGGGTNMGVGLEYATKKKPKPDVIICITDGYTPYPQEYIGIPTIVCITSNGTENGVPSWMRKIKITSDS